MLVCASNCRKSARMTGIKFKNPYKKFPFFCLIFINFLHLQMQLGLEVYIFAASEKENEFFH